MATQHVVASAKKELMFLEPDAKNKSSNIIKSNTQARRTSVSATPAAKTRRDHRRSSGIIEDDTEPEQQLARNLGLSLPAEDVTEVKRIEIFEKMLQERISRLEGHATGLQSSTETSVASHLLDANITLGLLNDSLLAESLYGKVQLVKPEVGDAVVNFEQDMQALQECLEVVNLHSLLFKNAQRDQFVQRWAR